MRSFAVLFFAAVLVSAALMPLTRRFAIRFRAVSRPGGRHVNGRAVPRLGGVAVAIGALAPLGATLVAHHSAVATALRSDTPKLVGLVAGGLFLCAVGFADDLRHLPPLRKLFCQVLAAAIAFACGYRIEAVRLPLFGDLPMGVFGFPVTALWIVGVTNAINLIDGLDGLAAGVAFFAGTTNFVVAYVNGSALVAAVMAAMLGAVVGFLFFNFNPARIFMGDSGSYFLGYVLGTVSLAGASQKASTAVSLLVPFIALGLPIVDMMFTILRRFLERRSIFLPDRGHIHHRLLDMGITHRRAVLLLYGVCLVLTCAAIGVSLGRSWTVGLAILSASVAVIVVVRFAGYFEHVFRLREQQPNLWDHDAARLRAAMPEVLGLLGTARNEVDVSAALRRLEALAGFDSVELVSVAPRETNSARPQYGDEDVLLEMHLGPSAYARSIARFRWRPLTGEPSIRCASLLQVVVDITAVTLTRVGSSHAPRPVLAAPPSLSAASDVRASHAAPETS